MFTPEFSFAVGLAVGLGYLFLYVVATTCVEQATDSLLSFFDVQGVLKENIGVVVRFFYQLPTYQVAVDELEALGLDRNTATEQDVLSRAEQLRIQMQQAPWAYPQSQYDALERLTMNGRIVAQCVALCRRYDRTFVRDEFAGAFV